MTTRAADKEGLSLARSAIKVSISTSVFLTLFKFAAGIATHSMAIMASALDSLMDVGSSTVNFIAAKEASKPPDTEHEYGHGKIESLAGLFQSMFIMASGLYLVYESIRRLIFGETLVNTDRGILVMSIAFCFTLGLVTFLTRVAKRAGSLIMQAEGLHFTSDVYTNLGTILALVLVKYTKASFWDLLLSLIIASIIFKSAWGILRQSIDELLDRSLPLEERNRIEAMIFEHDERIVGFHDFRSHKVGKKIFMDFHVEIRGITDFVKAHDITESLIAKIQAHYSDSDITIHYDPDGEK